MKKLTHQLRKEHFKRINALHEKLCKEDFKVGDRVKSIGGSVTLDSLGSGKITKQVKGTSSNPIWWQVKFDNGIVKDMTPSHIEKESVHKEGANDNAILTKAFQQIRTDLTSEDTRALVSETKKAIWNIRVKSQK